jgi:hypothetical protein
MNREIWNHLKENNILYRIDSFGSLPLPFLKESFSDATSTPHGYLFLDFKQETPENLRVRTNILEEKPIVYIKK